MLGKLYIVATPIGNLEDVTLRAVKVLSDVDIVLAEDTRVTKKLLDHIINLNLFTKKTEQKLISYHQHSSEEKKLEILSYLMNQNDIALVTDAGTPGISDPGNELIDYLFSFQPELQVVPIPGASAVSVALSVCGFSTSKFTFIGFVPKKKSKKLLEEALSIGIPVVFFESPYRIVKTLRAIKDLPLPPKRVFVGQELTKLYEKYLRGGLDTVIAGLEKEQKELGRVKGEIVVILEP